MKKFKELLSRCSFISLTGYFTVPMHSIDKQAYDGQTWIVVSLKNNTNKLHYIQIWQGNAQGDVIYDTNEFSTDGIAESDAYRLFKKIVATSAVEPLKDFLEKYGN